MAGGPLHIGLAEVAAISFATIGSSMHRVTTRFLSLNQALVCVILLSACDKSLRRPVAEELIVGSQGYPQPVGTYLPQHAQLGWLGTTDAEAQKVRHLYDELRTAGLISYSISPIPGWSGSAPGMVIIDATVTPKGVPFLTGNTRTDDVGLGYTYVEVRACERVFRGIAGIASSENEARAGYEWTLASATPFAVLTNECNDIGLTRSAEVSFARYDDGWRIQ